MSDQIVVYGAAGHTGRFVLGDLRARGRAPILVGRDGLKLEAVAKPGERVETAGLDDAASLDRAFAGAAAVLNCAGPFLDSARPVAEAALRGGAHYLDLAAEQESARHTLEVLGLSARAAGVALVPAAAFFGGLGDLLATATLGDWAEADAIRLAIGLDSWRPTLGTRLTGQRNTFARKVVREGELRDLESPPLQTVWSFPPPLGEQPVVELPFTESILIPRHLRVQEVRNLFATAPLGDLRNPDTPAPEPADGSGRSAQLFVMACEATRGKAVRRARVSGRDIYAISAPLVVEIAERLLQGGGRGGLAPAEVAPADAILAALAPKGLIVEIGSA